MLQNWHIYPTDVSRIRPLWTKRHQFPHKQSFLVHERNLLASHSVLSFACGTVVYSRNGACKWKGTGAYKIFIRVLTIGTKSMKKDSKKVTEFEVDYKKNYLSIPSIILFPGKNSLTPVKSAKVSCKSS